MGLSKSRRNKVYECVSEYKKKLYSFQEDAEQLEGFQTQEMAKIKHLVSFTYSVLSKPSWFMFFM